MPVATPTEPPQRFTAGDTLNFSLSYSDFPAGSGWTLAFILNKRGAGVAYTINASASDNAFLVNAPAATTANYVPGIYEAKAFVSKSPDRYQVWQGTIEIEADITTNEGGTDTRTVNRRILESIETAIQAAATAQSTGKGITEWECEGLRVKKDSPGEFLKSLTEQRDHYLVLVQGEEDAARIRGGLRSRRRILPRFV